MTYIEVDCQDQDLTITDAPLIASGDVLTDKVHFTFCQKWDGFAKTAVFYRDGVDNLEVLIDENNECVIPKEVLQEEGTFYFGVFGIKDNSVKTSEVMRYRIKQGAVSGTVAPDPTPDIYTQILTRMNNLGQIVTYISDNEIDTILEE